jgi:predicted nucleotidyltransferase
MPAKRKPAVKIKQPTVAQLKPAVMRITRAYGVRNVRIFGSFARGEQRKTSDVDLLVDPPDTMSLLDLSGLKIDLEDALHRKVDVVLARSIKPALREAILADARPL